jgi:hypothetical protein
MTASTAATTVRSNGKRKIEKKPTVTIASCASAATAPAENFHWKRNHRERTAFRELTTYLRADEFDATKFDGIAVGLQYLLQLLTNFTGFCAGLWRQSNEHVGIPAEALHLRIGKACAAQIATNLFEVCGLRIAHFQQDTAGEIDAELQAPCRERSQRSNHEECRYRERYFATLRTEEIDGRLVFDQLH